MPQISLKAGETVETEPLTYNRWKILRFDVESVPPQSGELQLRGNEVSRIYLEVARMAVGSDKKEHILRSSTISKTFILDEQIAILPDALRKIAESLVLSFYQMVEFILKYIVKINVTVTIEDNDTV